MAEHADPIAFPPISSGYLRKARAIREGDSGNIKKTGNRKGLPSSQTVDRSNSCVQSFTNRCGEFSPPFFLNLFNSKRTAARLRVAIEESLAILGKHSFSFFGIRPQRSKLLHSCQVRKTTKDHSLRCMESLSFSLKSILKHSRHLPETSISIYLKERNVDKNFCI